ncbi:hypothetical protein L1987_84638 [Smallanthus sonchifolius]|uniref:Uncharacterized protein n=1 Tax=Smallanthus sonchifolius TaxID=185202 RepID=A0ACB8XTP1_9ASTR|nr:hypothetical protein L1987_84638 [Smallanthus sonchifolius]
MLSFEIFILSKWSSTSINIFCDKFASPIGLLYNLANGRDAQTAANIISDINREETEANGDRLDDIDVDQPLNNPLDAASREESSTQRKRKRHNS